MHAPTLRRIAATVLFVGIDGLLCLAPGDQPDTEAPETDPYRVTLAGGRMVGLTDVSVRGDSLFATADSIRIVHG